MESEMPKKEKCKKSKNKNCVGNFKNVRKCQMPVLVLT